MSVKTQILTDDQFFPALSQLHSEIGDHDLLIVHYDLDGDARSHRIYRLYTQDHLIGYAVVSEFPNGHEDENGIPYRGTRWWLRSFVIVKAHQRQGHGKRFLSAIRADIPDDLYLETLAKSVEFYLRCGAWSLVDSCDILEGKSPMVLPKCPITTREQFETLVANTSFEGCDGFETTTTFFIREDE